MKTKGMNDIAPQFIGKRKNILDECTIYLFILLGIRDI